MAQRFLAFTILCSLLQNAQAWYRRCGIWDCNGLVECCGFNGEQCCYSSVWSLWWFWTIWVFVILVCMSCGFWCRHRRRQQVYYRIVPEHGAPTAYGTVHGTVPIAQGTTVYPQGATVHPPPYNPTPYPQAQQKPPMYNPA